MQKIPRKHTKENIKYLKKLITHDPLKCAEQNCCIHNPSNHHMKDWPMNWRSDKRVMERICPHGIGHPDPDDAAYNRACNKDYLNTHGCDGCCNPIET